MGKVSSFPSLFPTTKALPSPSLQTPKQSLSEPTASTKAPAKNRNVTAKQQQ